MGDGGVRVIAVGGCGICSARVFALLAFFVFVVVVVTFFTLPAMTLLVDGLIKTLSQEFIFSDSAELTPLEETPELDCLPAETLLIVEKPLVQDWRLVMEPR